MHASFIKAMKMAHLAPHRLTTQLPALIMAAASRTPMSEPQTPQNAFDALVAYTARRCSATSPRTGGVRSGEPGFNLPTSLPNRSELRQDASSLQEFSPPQPFSQVPANRLWGLDNRFRARFLLGRGSRRFCSGHDRRLRGW